MRNRILALFCVVAVLFGLLSSGTVTAVNAPAKIFELDLSAYKDVAYETSADYKDETSGTVYVGGSGFNSSWTSGNTYTIDSCVLARLNVYSGVLTETEVQKLYGDQRADFIEGSQAVVPSVTGELAKVDYNTYSAGTYTSAQLTELDEK